MNKSMQRRGGQSTVSKYGREYMRQIGARGGRATVKRYGRLHMAAIGRSGASVLYQRYQLMPYELNKFALVEKSTGKIKAIRA